MKYFENRRNTLKIDETFSERNEIHEILLNSILKSVKKPKVRMGATRRNLQPKILKK
jgi:hypothetical protein